MDRREAHTATYQAPFDRAFDLVVGVEGGYVNDPNDPGGETKYGICKRDHPNEDIKALTLERAKEIYREKYWNPIKGDAFFWPLSFFLFDCAVNQGVGVAIKLLQRALRLKEDGILGPVTMGAVRKMDQVELCALFMAHRGLRYVQTRNYDIYGKGWFKRLFRVAMGA